MKKYQKIMFKDAPKYIRRMLVHLNKHPQTRFTMS